MKIRTLVSALVALAPTVLAAQKPRAADEERLPFRDYPPPVPGVWYTGDTHEHLQNCDGSVNTLEDIFARMELEGLNLASILIWERAPSPFTQYVCLVTGKPEPISTALRKLQFTLETSGLDCSRWGHLIGMGMGTTARIAEGSLAAGDCADMPGLGLGCEGGDGTGALNALVAAHLQETPGTVTGYAHTAWTLGLYHPAGFDWNAELLASGFTTDARCLDADRRLSFPDLDDLIQEAPPPTVRALAHGGGLATFLPLLGPMDAALGEAQFFETTFLGTVSPVPLSPPVNWFGLYYKLLSAGLRVSITGGSDRACPLPGVDEHPQTSVLLREPFSFQAWLNGLAAGRTSLGVPGLRLELRLAGQDVGGELALTGPLASATAVVRVTSAATLADTVELVVDGVVVASRPVSLPLGGAFEASFPDVAFAESTWIAARLASQRAHTAAIYAIVDGQPIADCESAEYWMMWCDAVTKRTLEHPELEVFGCQEAEALERIARARRAFKTHRDVTGFEPSWDVTRYGLSSGACRGPIAMGVEGPVLAGQGFRLTCVNAPSEANGFLYLSRAADLAGPCVSGARRFVDASAGQLVGRFAVSASRSGYAERLLPAPAAGSGPLFAQFVWSNPPDCGGIGCGAATPLESASDALELVVH